MDKIINPPSYDKKAILALIIQNISSPSKKKIRNDRVKAHGYGFGKNIIASYSHCSLQLAPVLRRGHGKHGHTNAEIITPRDDGKTNLCLAHGIIVQLA
mmetsp:Transcript_6205/g.8772  ORF Transcript_6205/g.8772 Transcript_6205/m.8772 type:complete len:99 (-) Transcript_6205:999-1295(-)